MAGAIGSIGRDLTAFTPPAQRQRPEVGFEPANRGAFSSAQRGTQEIGSTTPAQRTAEPVQIRAGFGENTLSPAGAALFTLDSTVRSVRRNSPTLEEQRDELSSRLAELREITGRRPEGTDEPESIAPREVERPERGIEPPQSLGLELSAIQGRAADQTRGFIESLNNSAGQTLARFGGNEGSGNAQRPSFGGTSVRIGGQIFPVEESAPPTVLNVQV